MQSSHALLLTIASTIFMAGCNDSGGPPPAQQTSLRPVAPEPAIEAVPVQEQEPPVMVREEAQVGVGVKGRDLEAGLITTPIKTYFTAQEQLAFSSVEHAMNLYRATHDRYPRSYDEFMQDIVKANRIQLPELRSGHTYVYDPETGELMVEHPQ